MDIALAQLVASADLELLGLRVRQARLRAGMTQAELAGADASTGYVSRIESGLRRPDPALLERLAARLGTPATALVSGAPDPTRARVHVALDHAELALRAGTASTARQLLAEVRVELEDEELAGLRSRWSYLDALVLEADGQLDEAIGALEQLMIGPLSSVEATRYAVALSRCYRESGDLTRAIALGQAQLDDLRAQELDGTDESIQLAVTVSAAHYLLGDVAHAVRLSRRAVAHAESLGSPAALASAYWNASLMESQRGAHAAAVALAEKALQLLDRTESGRHAARLRSQLGIFQLRLDPPDLAAATANLEAAARRFEGSPASLTDRARNTVALARAELLAGASDRAYADAGQVLRQLRAIAPLVAVEALLVMGLARSDQGRTPEAVAHYRDAVGLLGGLGSDRFAAELWFELALLLDEADLGAEANAAYRSALTATGLPWTRRPPPRRRGRPT